jgi:DNA sulfur modification protein DndB
MLKGSTVIMLNAGAEVNGSRHNAGTQDPTAPNVTWVTHETLDEMYRSAGDEAAFRSCSKFPASIISEGARKMLNASVPIRELIQFTKFDSAKRSSTLEEVREAYNRPLDADHAREFTDYVVENIDDPFIPSFSLNSSEPITVHYVPKYGEYAVDIPMAIVVIPRTTKLSIIDGQHRIFGLRLAYERFIEDKNRAGEQILDQSSVPVLITIERDIRKSHLDFFDASRTKALPPSQLAAYDVRNVARAMLMDLVEQCPLFRGKRIDYTAAKMGKKTPSLYLFNQVYMAEKTFLVGNYANSEPEFHSKARAMLKHTNAVEYVAMRDRMVEYFNAVTEAIPLLREASHLSDDRLSKRIIDYRNAEIILFTATGLAMLARFGYDLRTANEAEWRDVVSRLGELNWKRSEERWTTAGVVANGKVSTAHKAVSGGANAIAKALGWVNPVKADPQSAAEPEINLDGASVGDEVEDDLIAL